MRESSRNNWFEMCFQTIHLEGHIAVTHHPTPLSQQVLAHPTARCERAKQKAKAEW